MPLRTISFAFVASLLLAGCGVSDTRDQVVYPHSKPIPRAASHAEQRSSCPGNAEELAPGSICPPSAQCFEIYGGRRCIIYER
ncbi:hypothetical protein [Microbulbifer rhizosphaerae]|uniref:Lipoprotein n=1 Tax=Microbulbifer rhizosphaerae TaxID=1562603 RepID=A0A7W4WG04_9GAMM|nr:hypothetical protein [Microbulbifer rhizosphaerae]MBB3063527.1 hypothetical protein [Microbulbifer rhizosphaerae]